jgi:photosystem II stability/assembly factor-like uncharacterized protein
MLRSLTILTSFVVISFIPQENLFAQWVQTKGPSGNRVNCLVVNGTDFFAGTQYNGVYSSTDDGITWNAINNGITDGSISSLAISGSSLFAGTKAGGVFRSTNGGISWSADGSGMRPYANVQALTTIGTNIFAGTNYGMYRSTNNGDTWDVVGNGLPNGFTCMAFGVFGTKIFASSGNSGVFVSIDNGANWDSVQGLLPNAFHYVETFAVNGQNIFVGTESYGAYRSIDGGITWSAVDSGIAFNTSCYSFVFNGTDILTFTSSGIYNSTNGGTSWSIVQNDLPETDTYPFATAIIGANVFIASYNGVLASTNNGIHWNDASNGLGFAGINALGVSGNTVFASINSYGVSSTSDNGDHWVLVNNGLPITSSDQYTTNPYVTVLAASGSDIYAGTNGSGVYRSTNNGQNWTQLDVPGNIVNSFAVDGAKIFAGTTDIYLSTNGGDNWELTSKNGPNGTYAILTFGNDLFASSDNGTVQLFRSTNEGASWTAADFGLPQFYSGNYIYSLAKVGGILFVGFNPAGIYRSTDDGQSWVADNLNLTNVYTLVSYGSDLFAGTWGGHGVYLSTDLGGSWNPIDQGLGDDFIRTLVISGDYIYAGTSQSGVWRRPLSEITAVYENPSTSPAQFSLAQNYPNPFSGVTNFEYGIPNEEHVALKVYNSLGEEVATLVNGEAAAGEHSATFNAENLQNGIYFYKLTAGKYAQTGKMAVVR